MGAADGGGPASASSALTNIPIHAIAFAGEVQRTRSPIGNTAPRARQWPPADAGSHCAVIGESLEPAGDRTCGD
jgi:hypothetical protein